MNIAIIIILVILLALCFINKREHLEKHKTIAYLIHEATSDQCFECRAIRNYFYNALGNQHELDLHSYHAYHDPVKIRELEDKYKFNSLNTPILVVAHDDGTHQLYRGYQAVHHAITMLRYHPHIERRLNL